MANVGKYTIHGSNGFEMTSQDSKHIRRCAALGYTCGYRRYGTSRSAVEIDSTGEEKLFYIDHFWGQLRLKINVRVFVILSACQEILGIQGCPPNQPNATPQEIRPYSGILSHHYYYHYYYHY